LLLTAQLPAGNNKSRANILAKMASQVGDVEEEAQC
jgi:hypothetical protein